MKTQKLATSLLGTLGAAALALTVTFGGPASTAQAAIRPDFKATVVPSGATVVGRGEGLFISGSYQSVNRVKGPASATLMVAESFGEPQISSHKGFDSCSKKHSTGYMAGWVVTCTASELGSSGAGIAILTMAPVNTGTYGVLAGVSPDDGGEDVDESDNTQLLRYTVR
jgi:hypothetical protein